MAEFITKCPHCNNNLQVQDEWIGMELECPQCRQKFVLAPGETAKPPFESDEKNCPFCGETIKSKLSIANIAKQILSKQLKDQSIRLFRFSSFVIFMVGPPVLNSGGSI